MKRVLGILLALTLVVGLSAAPSFSSPKPQDKKEEKGEKKKGEKGEKKKGEGKKKGEKKDESK